MRQAQLPGSAPQFQAQKGSSHCTSPTGWTLQGLGEERGQLDGRRENGSQLPRLNSKSLKWAEVIAFKASSSPILTVGRLKGRRPSAWKRPFSSRPLPTSTSSSHPHVFTLPPLPPQVRLLSPHSPEVEVAFPHSCPLSHSCASAVNLPQALLASEQTHKQEMVKEIVGVCAERPGPSGVTSLVQQFQPHFCSRHLSETFGQG